MKLAYVDLCGFRGYQKRILIKFAERFTIIDGRNGVGKSTIFDAIEFALTGTLSKYNEARAAGETVADYVWWTGKGPAPEDRFVEVGFRDDSEELQIRRTQFGEPDDAELAKITNKLCDPILAPKSPLQQLCSTSIIRDEHIASLSLDLKETERYALLRDALGANDADVWIEKGSRLASVAKRRLEAAQQEVTSVNTEFAAAARRIDEVRAALVAEESMAEAVERLRTFANTKAAPDRLAGPVRERLAAVVAQVEALQKLADRWADVLSERERLDLLRQTEGAARNDREKAAAALATIPLRVETSSVSVLAAEARDLVALVTLGRSVGLKDDACPLCATKQSEAVFNDGIAKAQAIAVASMKKRPAKLCASKNGNPPRRDLPRPSTGVLPRFSMLSTS